MKLVELMYLSDTGQRSAVVKRKTWWLESKAGWIVQRTDLAKPGAQIDAELTYAQATREAKAWVA